MTNKLFAFLLSLSIFVCNIVNAATIESTLLENAADAYSFAANLDKTVTQENVDAWITATQLAMSANWQIIQAGAKAVGDVATKIDTVNIAEFFALMNDCFNNAQIIVAEAENIIKNLRKDTPLKNAIENLQYMRNIVNNLAGQVIHIVDAVEAYLRCIRDNIAPKFAFAAASRIYYEQQNIDEAIQEAQNAACINMVRTVTTPVAEVFSFFAPIGSNF